MEPIVDVPFVPVTVIVDEASRLPDILKSPATVEEALEINPPYKLARLATDKVELAESGPEILKIPETVEDEEEMKPDRVDKPEALRILADKVEEELKTPLTNKLLEKVEEAEEMIPFMKLASPPKKELLETNSCEVEAFPVTAR